MKWVRNEVRLLDAEGELVDEKDDDMHLLAIPPCKIAKLYSKMKVYKKGGTCEEMAICNSGVDNVCCTPRENGNKRGKQNEVACVGLLKHIIHVDYGSVNTLIILMQCAMVRNGVGLDGAANYKRDKDNFLVVNCNELAYDTEAKLFVFPLQVHQCFFHAKDDAPNWRVVLHKESKSK